MKDRVEKFLDGKTEELNRLAERYPEERSLVVDWQELEKFDKEIAENLLVNPYGVKYDSSGMKTPTGVIDIFEQVLLEKNLPVLEPGKTGSPEFHVRVTKLPEEKGSFRIRELNSESLQRLVSVTATINHWISDKFISDPPDTAFFRCNACGQTAEQVQDRDDRLRGQIVSPIRCSSCGKMDFHFLRDESTWIDRQIVEIQEPKDTLEQDDWPRKIRLWIEGDLTNVLTNKDVGKKIVVTGVLRLHPFESVKFIEANNIELQGDEPEDFPIKKGERNKVIKWSERPKL